MTYLCQTCGRWKLWFYIADKQGDLVVAVSNLWPLETLVLLSASNEDNKKACVKPVAAGNFGSTSKVTDAVSQGLCQTCGRWKLWFY